MRMCWVSSIFSSYVNSSFMASICRWGWLFFFLSQKGTLTLFHPISWPKNPRRRRRNLQLCQHLQQNIDFPNPKPTTEPNLRKPKEKNVTQIATKPNIIAISTNLRYLKSLAVASETCQANSTQKMYHKNCYTKSKPFVLSFQFDQMRFLFIVQIAKPSCCFFSLYKIYA